MSVLPPGPFRIVALVITVGLTWILVTILLGGPGGGFPRIQQLFTSKCGALPCLAAEVPRVASRAWGLMPRVGWGRLEFSIPFLACYLWLPSAYLLAPSAAFSLPTRCSSWESKTP
jgi:hypothetical protein